MTNDELEKIALKLMSDLEPFFDHPNYWERVLDALIKIRRETFLEAAELANKRRFEPCGGYGEACEEIADELKKRAEQ